MVESYQREHISHEKVILLKTLAFLQRFQANQKQAFDIRFDVKIEFSEF